MDARFQRRVQRYGWDKAASLYENSWSAQLAPAHKRLLEMANLQLGESVIDIACGTGLVSFPAAQLVTERGSVLGTDISDGMIQEAQRTAEQRGFWHVSFARMDGADLKLTDEIFDIALCALGLLYYPEPLAGLREMCRVLRPGGRAVAAVWGQRDRCGWAGIFPVVDARVKSQVCPMFFQLGSGDVLQKTFAASGFTDLEEARISVILHYDSAEEACSSAFAGGPVALAYSKFDELTRESAHNEYLQTISDYRNGHGYDIPGEFVVVSGTKPRNQSGMPGRTS